VLQELLSYSRIQPSLREAGFVPLYEHEALQAEINEVCNLTLLSACFYSDHCMILILIPVMTDQIEAV
jgi:hypothetical protein